MATINGTSNSETLKGGAGNDVITGFAGNDRALMGGGNDVFVWNPGDGNDTIRGGTGSDTLRFSGGNSSEALTLAADGTRAVMFRSVDNVALIVNEVERVDLRAGGGGDAVVVTNMAGTGVKQVAIDLAGAMPGVGDSAIDDVTLNGKNGNDTINLAFVNDRISVTGLAAQVTIRNADANDALHVTGGTGNDIINASLLSAGLMRVELRGGEGADRITGSQGNDTLTGEGGNDTVAGGKGTDTAFLGAGNDLYAWSVGDGSDFVTGGTGVDTLRVSGSNANEMLSLSGAGGFAFFARNIISQAQANEVERLELRALGGADLIEISDFTNTHVKQVTVDLAATAGGTLADTKADTVWIHGSSKHDVMDVGWINGRLRVSGLTADVTVAHAGTNDTVIVTAGVGNDVLSAATMPAGKLRLQLQGDSGDDTMFGSVGNDIIVGGAGADVAFMGAGNDRYLWTAGDGNDRIEGQGGTDTLVASGTSSPEYFSIYVGNDRLEVANGSAVLNLNDVERIDVRTLGGQDNVNVFQEALADTDLKRVSIDLGLAGGAGDGNLDWVYVEGTNGNDQITIAMAGNAVSVTGLHAQVTVAHGEAMDMLTIVGGAGDDVINAASLPGGIMQVQLSGGLGNDTITGSAGNDDLSGFEGDDKLRGGAGMDLLNGHQGNDTLDGGAGVDFLLGDAGDDVILGGLGDDGIFGGSGDDTLTGGAGNDTFGYNDTLDGHDVILDFDGDPAGGQDVLNLNALFDGLFIADGSRAALVDITDNGGTVEIRVNADGNGANGFELHVATLHTVDVINVGQDLVVAA